MSEVVYALTERGSRGQRKVLDFVRSDGMDENALIELIKKMKKEYLDRESSIRISVEDRVLAEVSDSGEDMSSAEIQRIVEERVRHRLAASELKIFEVKSQFAGRVGEESELTMSAFKDIPSVRMAEAQYKLSRQIAKEGKEGKE